MSREDTPIVLVRAVQTCIIAPCQWNAWDANGRYFYLWFRGGKGWIGRNYDKYDCVDSFSFEDASTAAIELEDFCDILGIRWEPTWYIPGMTLEEPYTLPESVC